MKRAKEGQYILFIADYLANYSSGPDHRFKKYDVYKALVVDCGITWVTDELSFGTRAYSSDAVLVFDDRMDALEKAEDLRQESKPKKESAYWPSTPTPTKLRYNRGDRISIKLDGQNYDFSVYGTHLGCGRTEKLLTTLGLWHRRGSWAKDVYGYADSVGSSQTFPEWRRDDMVAANAIIKDILERVELHERKGESKPDLHVSGKDLIGRQSIAIGTSTFVPGGTQSVEELRRYLAESDVKIREKVEEREVPEWMKTSMSPKKPTPSKYTQRVKDPSSASLEVKRLTVRKKRRK